MESIDCLCIVGLQGVKGMHEDEGQHVVVGQPMVIGLLERRDVEVRIDVQDLHPSLGLCRPTLQARGGKQ